MASACAVGHSAQSDSEGGDISLQVPNPLREHGIDMKKFDCGDAARQADEV